MAHEEYDVEVDLSLKRPEKIKKDSKKVADNVEKVDKEAKQAKSSLDRLPAIFTRMAASARTLGATLMRSRSSSTHLVRNMVALGATYVSIRMVSSAIERIAGGALRANSEVESMQLRIASLISSVEQISFGEAIAQAGRLRSQMEMLAIESPGTAADISNVFQMALGPMRRAGVQMGRLLEFSRDAVAVGSALGIDMPQVARDISMMATGVAGTDVRTFRTLRAMGLITESTEEWNRIAQRTPAVIATRLTAIFDRLGRQSAEAFGRTWQGVASAFEDITQFFMRALTSPAFRVLRDNLRRLNDVLLKFRSGIEKLLRGFGGRFARALQAMISRTARFFEWVIANLTGIADRVDRIIGAFRRFAPMLRTLAITALALKGVTVVLGVVITGLGTVIGMIGSVASAIVPLLGGGGLAGLLGVGGAGVAAGGVAAGGTAAAATGGVAILLALFLPLLLLPATIAIVSTALQALAVVGTFVAAMFVAIWRQGDALMGYLEGVGSRLAQVASHLYDFARGIWAVVSPALETLGFLILGAVAVGFDAFVRMLLFFSQYLAVAGGYLAVFGAVFIAPLGAQIRVTFHLLFASIRETAAAFTSFAQMLGNMLGLSLGAMISTPTLTAGSPTDLGGDMRRLIADFMHAMGPTRQATSEEAGRGAPAGRQVTNIDMRGSTIRVRQEFRDADPDRILIQMRDDLEREVVARTSSALVPALTR